MNLASVSPQCDGLPWHSTCPLGKQSDTGTHEETMNWNFDDAILEVSGWLQILTIIWST
jgi:hypothetical protein